MILVARLVPFVFAVSSPRATIIAAGHQHHDCRRRLPNSKIRFLLEDFGQHCFTWVVLHLLHEGMLCQASGVHWLFQSPTRLPACTAFTMQTWSRIRKALVRPDPQPCSILKFCRNRLPGRRDVHALATVPSSSVRAPSTSRPCTAGTAVTVWARGQSSFPAIAPRQH